MKLTEIIKKTIAAGVLAASAFGCSYFKHVPDDKIENVTPKKDAAWAEEYKKIQDPKEFDKKIKEAPFGKMTAEELVKYIKTPYEARLYLLWLDSRNIFKERVKYSTTSLPMTHYNATKGDKVNDCSDMAIAAAALLNDDGYAPLILRIEEVRFRGASHEAFIYKENNKLHVLDCRRKEENPAGYDRTVFLIPNEYLTYFIKKYAVYNLNDINKDWQTTKENLLNKLVFPGEKLE